MTVRAPGRGRRSGVRRLGLTTRPKRARSLQPRSAPSSLPRVSLPALLCDCRIAHGFTAYSPSVNHYAYQAPFDDGTQITNHEIHSWTYNVYQTDQLHGDPAQAL